MNRPVVAPSSGSLTSTTTTQLVTNRLDSSSAFDTRNFAGRWYLVARYGVHADLFTGPIAIQWILTKGDDRYYSVRLEIIEKSGERSIYKGSLHMTSDGILTPILNIDETVLSFGQFIVHYTDYADLAFLGHKTDLWVWKRMPGITRTQATAILAKVESYGYRGHLMRVNAASLVPQPSGRAELYVTSSPPYSSNRDVPSTVNTKVTIDAYDTAAPADATPSTGAPASPYFERGPSILL